MLMPSDLVNVKFMGMYDLELQDNIVVFKAKIKEFGFYEGYTEIGYYDLEAKQGRILLEGFKEIKQYKNLKSMYNAIWKNDSNASITSLDYIKDKIHRTKKTKIDIIDASQNNTCKYQVTRKEIKTGKQFITTMDQIQLNNITKYPSSLYELVEIKGL